MPNRNKIKGTNFEYEWMYYLLYHHFDNVRSYASIGVADVRSVPPKWAKSTIALASQCKNTKKGDYIDPAERKRLGEYADKYSYFVIEPFKKNRTCYVKLEPWKLDGRIILPEQFLKEFYGMYADSWKRYRANWKRGIKRQPNNKNYPISI